MIVAEKDYLKLIKRLPLVPIRNDAHLRAAGKILIELSSKDMTSGERDYFRVLGDLVGEYEDKRYPIPAITPIEAFQFLMEENGLSRAEMGEIIGCRANRVTEILNDKRELSKEQIARLSARFKVSANLFLPSVLKKVS